MDAVVDWSSFPGLLRKHQDDPRVVAAIQELLHPPSTSTSTSSATTTISTTTTSNSETDDCPTSLLANFEEVGVDELPLTDLVQELAAMKEVMGEVHGELALSEARLQTFLFEDVLEMTKQGQMIQYARKNRQEALAITSQLLQKFLLDQDTVQSLLSAPVDRDYVSVVEVLEEALNNVEELLAVEPSSQLLAEVSSVLGRLRDKAVLRVREALLSFHQRLAKPRTNIQIIQQSYMIHLAPLYSFLDRHCVAAAEEVKLNYYSTIAPIFLSYFQEYYRSLQKMMHSSATKHDLLGVVPSVMKSFVSLLPGAEDAVRVDLYSLGTRDRILTVEDVIVSHAPTGTITFPRVMASWSRLLMSTIASECWFERLFFVDAEWDGFYAVFSPILNLYKTTVASTLASCYDIVGILLVVCVISRHHTLLHNAHIMHLDPFLATLHSMLIQRSETLLDAHVASLSVHETFPNFSLQPHLITRRLAELLGAVEVILPSLPSAFQPQLFRFLTEVQRSYLDRLLASAATLPQLVRHSATVNNLDIILIVLGKHGIESTHQNRFEKLFQEEVQLVVSAQLHAYFKALVSFVDNEGSAYQYTKTQTLKGTHAKFVSSWKAHFHSIHTQSLKSFPNLRVTALVLQQTFGEVIQYYSSFLELLKRQYPTLHKELAPDFVPVTIMKSAIKSYRVDT